MKKQLYLWLFYFGIYLLLYDLTLHQFNQYYFDSSDNYTPLGTMASIIGIPYKVIFMVVLDRLLLPILPFNIFQPGTLSFSVTRQLMVITVSFLFMFPQISFYLKKRSTKFSNYNKGHKVGLNS